MTVAHPQSDLDQVVRLQEDVKRLTEVLRAAEGYLLNAAIDLETGAPKRTALNTINGGLKLVRAALPRMDGA